MSDSWIAKTIIPKSDQLNADDLITGPITVTVVDVRQGDSDQPVAIVIDGRQPYKPCKTMRRLLVALWGDQASYWVGKRMTLYADPDVKWGGVAVGGIRISAVSNIVDPTTVVITETRGKRKVMTIQPIVSKPSEDPFLTFWRAKIKGLPSSTMPLAGRIAAAYNASDSAALDAVVVDVKLLTDEPAKAVLMKFAEAVFDEWSK